MNVINEIIKKADSFFEEAWKHESNRWANIVNNMNEWNETHEHKAPNDYFVAVKLLGWNENNLKNMYNRMSKADYNKMKSMVNELRILNHKGLDKYLLDKRNEYFEMLTAKMVESLNKYVADWELDNDYEVELRHSEKGYIIFARVKKNNKKGYIETSCIPAGGWNIQIFHYRYRSNFKILD